jgi:hypothetical protein
MKRNSEYFSTNKDLIHVGVSTVPGKKGVISKVGPG